MWTQFGSTIIVLHTIFKILLCIFRMDYSIKKQAGGGGGGGVGHGISRGIEERALGNSRGQLKKKWNF